MKINLKKNIILLDGTDSGVGMGQTLANSLVSQAQGNVVKLTDWAHALYKGQEIEVDNADLKYLQDFITNSQAITVLAKRQMLDELNHKS